MWDSFKEEGEKEGGRYHRGAAGEEAVLTFVLGTARRELCGIKEQVSDR